MDTLNKVFANEKAAGDEGWAGARLFLNVRAVSIIDRQGNLFSF
jgi:hypothetical protein